jgi:hypothetical protein
MLYLGVVSRAGDDVKPAARQRGVRHVCVSDRDDSVLLAADDLCWQIREEMQAVER